MKQIIFAGLVAAGVALPSALGVPIKYVQVPNPVAVDVTQTGGYSGSVYAGFYVIRVGNPGSEFKSFCLDLYDFSDTSYHDYSKAALKDAPQSVGNSGIAMGTLGAEAVKKLWAMNYQTALSNPATAAALQVAIWEAVNDADVGLNLAGGSFVLNTTGSIRTAAQAMLDAVGSYNGPTPDLFAWVNTTDATHYQDYIGVPDGGATLMLLGMGVCGLAFVSRRCRR
ncbi:MAG: VPDSG-CTERM sorting domain-containing protein [Verrucomicrobia bacterium]|nr:VPDSG-CTERM sorting domain-containing protein [Verrucomicrobiota bacterium]